MARRTADVSRLALLALRSAVRKVIMERKRSGRPLIVWKDGKVARIPASQL